MQTTNERSREELLEQLRSADDLIARFSQLTEEETEERTNLQAPNVTPPVLQKPSMPARWIIIVAGIFIGFIIWMYVQRPILSPLLQDKTYLIATGGEPEYLFWSILSFVLSIVLLVALCVGTVFAIRFYFRRKTKDQRLANEQMERDYEAKVAAADAARHHAAERLVDLANEIGNARQSINNEVMPWYPPAYVYPEASRWFVKAVENYRAESMPDLVNLYETHLHQMRLENLNAEQARQAQISAQLQMTLNQRMEENNRLTAIGNEIAKANLAANIATAASSAMTAASTRSIASNTARTAANSGEAVRQAKRAADAASAPRKVNVTVNRR